MPSDLFIHPSAVLNSNKFGILADTFTKEIYTKYDKLSLRVNRVLEVALSIVYDLYHSWVDMKSADPKKYESFINRSTKDFFNYQNKYAITKQAADLLKNENSDLNWKYNNFHYFIDAVLNSTSYSHIGLVTSKPSEYLTAISLLRAELANDSDFNDLIKIDIGATHNEFPFVKKTQFSEANNPAFAFKVVPTLTKVILHTTDSMKENTIPEFKYTVNIDINRLIQTIINFYDPSALSDALAKGENDKDVFIQNGLTKFKNCPEIFTRKIILELFDNYCNVYGNWEQFIKRFKDVADKLAKDDYISNITIKLSHFNMISPNLENSIFDFYESYRGDLDTKNFIQYEDMMENLINNSWNPNESELFMNLFAKSFKVFFSTAVAFNIYKKMNSSNIETMSIYGYYKEFFAKYDTNALLLRTGSISDYITRDFFQSIIKESNGQLIKPYASKMKNGENAYFMFCKMRRNIWIDMTVSTLITFKLLNMIKNCEISKSGILKPGFFEKCKHSLFSSFQSCIEAICNLNHNEMITWQTPIFTSRTYLESKIKYIGEILRAITMEQSMYYSDSDILSSMFSKSEEEHRFDMYAISSFDFFNVIYEKDRYESLKNTASTIVNNYKLAGLIPVFDNVDDDDH